MSGLRQVARAQTRQRICDASRELFTRRGLGDTTAQMIADQAQVAVGSLFQHASDKEDLLMLVVHDAMAEATRAAAEQPSTDDLLTDLTLAFGSLFEVVADMERAARESVRAQWFGVGHNARAVQWLYESFLEQVVVRLERAQQAGVLAEGADGRLLAANLSGIHQGILLDWVGREEELEAAIGRLRAAFALQVIPLQTSTPGEHA